MERRGDSPTQYPEPDEKTGEMESVWAPGGLGDQLAGLLGLAGLFDDGPGVLPPKVKPPRTAGKPPRSGP